MSETDAARAAALLLFAVAFIVWLFIARVTQSVAQHKNIGNWDYWWAAMIAGPLALFVVLVIPGRPKPEQLIRKEAKPPGWPVRGDLNTGWRTTK